MNLLCNKETAPSIKPTGLLHALLQLIQTPHSNSCLWLSAVYNGYLSGALSTRMVLPLIPTGLTSQRPVEHSAFLRRVFFLARFFCKPVALLSTSRLSTHIKTSLPISPLTGHSLYTIIYSCLILLSAENPGEPAVQGEGVQDP
jgi:hypothetical protein